MSFKEHMPSAIIGFVAGVEGITFALAISALIFVGPLASGMGLGVGIMILSGALVALIVALRSVLPYSIAHLQEATVAILAASILSMAIRSSNLAEINIATAVAIMGCASILSGVLFWIMGHFRFGALVRFLPYPVVAGFLAGSGWLLVDGAVHVLTNGSIGPGLFSDLASMNILLRVIPAVMFALVMLIALNRFSSSLTMPTVMGLAIVLFYLVLWVVDINSETARSLGHLPALNQSGTIELPTPDLISKIDWGGVLTAIPAMFVIAGLSMIGIMLNTSGLEVAVGRDIDVNAELKTTGFANMASGFVGGPTGFIGLGMTVLAEKTGANSRLAGISTAIVLLLGLFAAGPLVFQVPVFMTAGFILFLGLDLLNQWLVKTRRKMPMSEWLTVVVILLAIAVIGFMEGLGIGLLISSGLFVLKYSRLPVVRRHETGVFRRSKVDRSPAHTQYLTEHGHAIEIIELQGYLFFGTADRVVNLIRSRLADISKPIPKIILLDFGAVSGCDSAAMSSFSKICRLIEADRIKIVFTGLPSDLKHNLTQAGISHAENKLVSMNQDFDHALEVAEEETLGDAEDIVDDKSMVDYFTTALGAHPRIAELINFMTKKEMQPEEVLIRQGDAADDVFFVSKGRVRVQVTLPDGKALRVRTMLAGAIVGEIAHYLQQERTADVIVDAPSEIYCLSADDFRNLEKRDAELAALAHRLLAWNLSEKLSIANKAMQAR